MSVTVIREGDVLQIIDSTEPIPEGVTLVLYTADEVNRLPVLTTWETVQLDTVEDDWGAVLDSLTIHSEE